MSDNAPQLSWLQKISAALTGNLKANMYREGVEVSGTNPVPITGTVVSSGAELRIEDSLVINNRDQSVSAYSGTTSIGDDYILNQINLIFSTTEDKDILITTSKGVILVDEKGIADKIVRYNGKREGFDSGTQITIAVSQTSGACLMSLEVLIERGALPLTGNPVLDPRTFSIISPGNTTFLALDNGTSFTGVPELDYHTGLLISSYSDTAIRIVVRLSMDGTNYYSSTEYFAEAGVYDQHKLVKGPETVRVEVYNDSGDDQTILQVQTSYGEYDQITSGLGRTIQKDADAAVVRNFPAELEVALGKYEGYASQNRSGIVTIASAFAEGSGEQDVWRGGGAYTGFPTGATDTASFVSTDAGDTGIVAYRYLASSTDTSYTPAAITLNGTTPVNTAHQVYRLNAMQYASGSASAANAGQISVYRTSTAANVFSIIKAGYGLSVMLTVTIPAESTGLIRDISVHVDKRVPSVVTGVIWMRPLNGSPTLSRPFSVSDTDPYLDSVFGGLALAAGTDIIIRILSCTADNTIVTATANGLLVDQS